jgi:hypothetical protein
MRNAVAALAVLCGSWFYAIHTQCNAAVMALGLSAVQVTYFQHRSTAGG